MNVIAITPYLDTRTGKTRYFDQYGKEYNYNPAIDGLYGVSDFFKKINPFKKKEGGSTVGNFLRNVKTGVTRFFAPDETGNPGSEIPAPPVNPTYPSAMNTSGNGVMPPSIQSGILPGGDTILGMPKNTALSLGIGVVAAGAYYYSKKKK